MSWAGASAECLAHLDGGVSVGLSPCRMRFVVQAYVIFIFAPSAWLISAENVYGVQEGMQPPASPGNEKCLVGQSWL